MDYVNLLSNVGFPIAMCFFIVIRLEQSLKKNTEAINQLAHELKMRRV